MIDRNADIYRRHRCGETLASIAKDYAISRERVRQICFDQYLKEKHNIEASKARAKLDFTQLYDWIMYQDFDKQYDTRVRTRAYNALRFAYLVKNNYQGSPTVDFLLEMDEGSIRKIRGIGETTMALITDVRKRLFETRQEKASLDHTLNWRLTYIGADQKVHLKSTVNKDTAMCRLYAYENTQYTPCDIHNIVGEMGLRIGIDHPPKLLDFIELCGMLAPEELFVEFKEHPEYNGIHTCYNLPDIPHVAAKDYLIWWRAWTYEPDQKTMSDTAWKEP